MASKKAVAAHQVYGSSRCLRQASLQRPTEYSTLQSTPRNKRCMQPQTLPHSRSITALPNVEMYDSYATLPLAAADVDHAARAPFCERHSGNAHADSWYHSHYRCCRLYNASPTPACVCASQAYQQRYQRAAVAPNVHADGKAPRAVNGCAYGRDAVNHLTDEEDSAFPGFHDMEFNLLHRNIPALRRTGVDTASIRQYYYPDGGWGWIICGVAFLVHILTTGLQLSYPVLLYYAETHLRDTNGIEWLGALSWSISMLVSPFVITFCRRKSTRLLAVVGGLMLPLGILFTSFAMELGQIIFSYGIVFGVGVAMVRESSTIMLGNYFKRRRQFVEMVAMSGEGVGIALFSVILKEGIGKAGWRLGLQIIAALVSVSFFMGLLYRPASLYHPQRRAIQHLKNQKKKMRENKMPNVTTAEQKASRYFFIEISPLKSTTVKVLLMTAGVSALGIYTPMFAMSINGEKGRPDVQDIVLLQTFLGISTALGIVLASTLLRRPFKLRTFIVTTQVVSQVFISAVAIAILFLSFVRSFKGLCFLSWIYGIGFGGFRYSLKILALERIKIKQFAKAWGLLRGVESIPVLISVPLTTFLNDYSLKYGRAGYYICSAAAAIAGIIIFFINYSSVEQSICSSNKKHANGAIPSLRPYAHQCKPHMLHDPTAEYVYSGCGYPAPDLLNRSCISLNQVDTEHVCRGAYGDHWRLQGFPDTPCAAHELIRRRGCHAHPSAHYDFEQGCSDGRVGKRLQKSLSFIQNPYCYEGQWYCNCHENYRLPPAVQDSRTTQPVLCTCSPSSAYFPSSSRSRSVPEGLSTIAQQCKCKGAPSREVIYLSRNASQLHCFDYDFACRHNPKGVQIQHAAALTPRYRHQRSQSLSKPIHYVEQITTSV